MKGKCKEKQRALLKIWLIYSGDLANLVKALKVVYMSTQSWQIVSNHVNN
jgi:hypothetical protein